MMKSRLDKLRSQGCKIQYQRISRYNPDPCKKIKGSLMILGILADTNPLFLCIKVALSQCWWYCYLHKQHSYFNDAIVILKKSLFLFYGDFKHFIHLMPADDWVWSHSYRSSCSKPPQRPRIDQTDSHEQIFKFTLNFKYESQHLCRWRLSSI